MTLKTLSVLLLAVGLSWAQVSSTDQPTPKQSEPATTPTSKEYPANPPGTSQTNEKALRVRSVVDAALATPPEFAADGLLTLIELDLVSDRETQHELLERVFFDFAPSAQEKMQLHWEGVDVVTNTANRLSYKGFDGLSLKARAAEGMLSLEPATAVRWFEQIQLPVGESFSCEDRVYWLPTVYYDAMSRVVDSIAEPADKTSFLLAHLTRLESAAQVAPLAKILMEIQKGSAGRNDDLVPALYLFAERLPKLNQDRRTFTAEFNRALKAIAALASESPIDVREYLVGQARKWIVRAANHGICQQRTKTVLSYEGEKTTVHPIRPRDAFNGEVAQLGRGNPTIDSQEIVTKGTGPAPQRGGFSDDYTAFTRMRTLLDAEDRQAKESSRWKIEVEKYIDLVSEWDAPQEHEDTLLVAHYLEKAYLLQQTLSVERESAVDAGVPKDYIANLEKREPADILGRDRVILALGKWYVSPVANQVYRRRRAQWFQAPWSLLRSYDRSPETDEMLVASPHPVLQMYGLLARLATLSPRGRL